MKHRNKKTILGRKRDPRKALMRGLATSMIIYGKIQTTETKAKAMRPMVEKLITTAKAGQDDLNARRKLLEILYHKKAVAKALEVLGPKYKNRPGGYTRITHLGTRQGDGAKMVNIEFV